MMKMSDLNPYKAKLKVAAWIAGVLLLVGLGYWIGASLKEAEAERARGQTEAVRREWAEERAKLAKANLDLQQKLNGERQKAEDRIKQAEVNREQGIAAARSELERFRRKYAGLRLCPSVQGDGGGNPSAASLDAQASPGGQPSPTLGDDLGRYAEDAEMMRQDLLVCRAYGLEMEAYLKRLEQ